MGKPRPFSRPSIAVSTEAQSTVKRAWQEISPHLIEEGDIIMGFGLVERIVQKSVTQDQAIFEFAMKNGTTHRIVVKLDQPYLVESLDPDHANFVPHVLVFTRVRG